MDSLPSSPQSHQCGFIAQSVQSIDELKHAVVDGQAGDDGKESIMALNYNAIFTYAVKSNTRVEPNILRLNRCKSTNFRHSSEALVDELCRDYIVVDTTLVLYILNVVVVRFHVHAVIV
ncbi:MAG: hypothetical protein ACKPKO_09500 [Candidatus Fonsibacter sp.]